MINHNQKTLQISALIILIALFTNVIQKLHANPIDLYDVVDAEIGANNDEEKFLMKMVDYFTETDTDTDGGDSDVDYGRQPLRQSPMGRDEMCNLPQRKGLCRALIPRWRYDVITKECAEFKFGGCDGNMNNFSSHKQCMDSCKGV